MNDRSVAIVGVGYSAVGRNLGLTARQLTVQSTRAALADAGIEAGQIDGIGVHATSADEVIDDALSYAWMLGISPVSWYATSSALTPAFSHPAIQAYAAIKAGLCDTAIVIRTMLQQPSAGRVRRPPAAAEPSIESEFLEPFGAGAGTQWAALMMRRYMHEHRSTVDAFARHAVNKRRFATMNPDALLREPIDTDGYFASPLTSDPVRRLDCDYPCDVSSAVIFSTAERAADCRARPVFVESAALSAIADVPFELLPDLIETAPIPCAADLWARTSLTPRDVDCAQLYDGFSIITFQWLEALGFCGPGEAGDFILDGQTELTGSLPLNTDGGACNVGRRHGANFCIEAVRQLRGDCGERQVDDADVAVYANAVGAFAGAMLLTR